MYLWDCTIYHSAHSRCGGGSNSTPEVVPVSWHVAIEIVMSQEKPAVCITARIAAKAPEELICGRIIRRIDM